MTQVFQSLGATLDLGCRQGRCSVQETASVGLRLGSPAAESELLGDTGRGRPGALTSHFLIPVLRSDDGLAGTRVSWF